MRSICFAGLIASNLLLQGNVEMWLGNLLQEARKSLHAVIRTAAFAIKDSSFKLIEFLDTFPAQVTSIFLQLYRCHMVMGRSI